jgi:hypothetical protein
MFQVYNHKKNSTFWAVIVTASILTVVMVSGCSMIPLTVNRPIVNNTGATITQVYIRNTGSTDWGRQLNQKARTRQETVYSQGGSYTRTVYVTDYNGNYVYDIVNVDNGTSWPYSFQTPRVPEGQTPQLKTIDVRLVDNNGFVYGKNDIDLAQIERIVVTQNDMYPVLVMQNNTGFPINIETPISENVADGGRAIYQMPELKDDRSHTVSYSVANSNYRFDKAVTLNNHITLSLTDRPPTVTVHNNTGYPVTITNPFQESVTNGAYSLRYPKNSINDNRQIISYSCGTFEYKKEVTIDNEDVVLMLTEKDRPPIVTVLNNTGNTVNLVFLRNPGSNWPDQNMLTLKLKEDGTLDDTEAATQAGERRGSFTNKETFRFWLGNIRVKPDKYDIRMDDVQGHPYVKNNVQIAEDMTLTFTQEDKP